MTVPMAPFTSDTYAGVSPKTLEDFRCEHPNLVQILLPDRSTNVKLESRKTVGLVIEIKISASITVGVNCERNIFQTWPHAALLSQNKQETLKR